MPDNEKTVDLDTSGPGARVELPEVEKEAEKTYENEEKKNEPNVTYDDQPDSASEKSSEQSNVRDEKNEGGEIMPQKWKAEFHLLFQQLKKN